MLYVTCECKINNKNYFLFPLIFIFPSKVLNEMKKKKKKERKIIAQITLPEGVVQPLWFFR